MRGNKTIIKYTTEINDHEAISKTLSLSGMKGEGTVES